MVVSFGYQDFNKINRFALKSYARDFSQFAGRNKYTESRWDRWSPPFLKIVQFSGPISSWASNQGEQGEQQTRYSKILVHNNPHLSEEKKQCCFIKCKLSVIVPSIEGWICLRTFRAKFRFNFWCCRYFFLFPKIRAWQRNLRGIFTLAGLIPTLVHGNNNMETKLLLRVRI